MIELRPGALNQRQQLPGPAHNLAIEASSADVLFMIDDDAYMYPGCAEKVMTVFEADAGKQIAAVGPAPAANPPATRRDCAGARHSFAAPGCRTVGQRRI